MYKVDRETLCNRAVVYSMGMVSSWAALQEMYSIPLLSFHFEADVSKIRNTNHVKFFESFHIILHIIKRQRLATSSSLWTALLSLYLNSFRLLLQIDGVPIITLMNRLNLKTCIFISL